MVIARSVFWKLHEGGLLAIWLFFDYVCDFIYLLDMAVQFRTGEWNKRHHDDDGGRCNLHGVCVRVRAFVYACECSCVCVYTSLSVSYVHITYERIHAHINTYIHTFIRLYMHAYIHTLHTYALTHTHTHTHTHGRTYVRTHDHPYVNTFIHACTSIGAILDDC